MLPNDTSTDNTTVSGEFTEHTEGVIAFLIAVHVFLMASTVTGNVLICAAVYKFRALRTPSNFILASLAASDILMGIVFFNRVVILALGRHYGKACHTTSELAFTNTCVILLHISIISIERLLAIKYPLRYPSIITKSRAIILLFATWVFAILGTVLVPHINLGKEVKGFGEFREDFHVCSDPKNNVQITDVQNPYAFFVLSFYLYFPFVVVMFSYGYIFRVSLEQRKRVKKEASSFKKISSRRRRNLELKAAKTLGLVVGVFTVGFVPMFVVLVFQQAQNSTKIKDLSRILSLIATTSACINPIVYTWGNMEFRKAFKILLTFRRKLPLNVSEKVAFSTTAGLVTNGSTAPHKIV